MAGGDEAKRLRRAHKRDDSVEVVHLVSDTRKADPIQESNSFISGIPRGFYLIESELSLIALPGVHVQEALRRPASFRERR
jgi:hypothetical protein